MSSTDLQVDFQRCDKPGPSALHQGFSCSLPSSIAEICSWKAVQEALRENAASSCIAEERRQDREEPALSVEQIFDERLTRQNATGKRYFELPLSVMKEPLLPFEKKIFYHFFMKYKRKKHCFLRKLYQHKFNQKYEIVKVITMFVLKYELATMREKRHRMIEEEPYYPETFTSEENPSRTSEWDVKINVPKNGRPVKKKIPGSSSVSSCGSCSGDGYILCSRCKGDGQHQCDACHGSGHTSRSVTHNEYNHSTNRMETRHAHLSETCHECHGATYIRCHYCYGKCKSSCTKCDGTGQLETSSHVVAKWTDMVNRYYFSDQTYCFQVLEEAEGVKIFEEKAEFGVVQPLTEQTCCSEKIQSFSNKILNQHLRCAGGSGLIRKQEHSITKIPVYKVIYKKRNSKRQTHREVWVFGTNYNIHKYPDK